MRSLLAVLCTFFSIQTFASNFRDSIGVENNDGHQLIIHKVKPKETYYSIGRLYHVSPKTIVDYNKNIPLHIGTLVKVPTSRPFSVQSSTAPSETSRNSTTNTPAANSPEALAEDFTLYKVGPKETLFSIARRFDTNVEELKRLNNLKNNGLRVGQVLKVKRISSPGSNAVTVLTPDANKNETGEGDSSASDQFKIPTGRLGVTERSERGVAVWIDDENLDSKKMLALHRTAPVGTVIKITNPMTDRTTFAKVVGKFTENETTRDVIIVITKATADLLGALDKRFQVSIDYGMPSNE